MTREEEQFDPKLAMALAHPSRLRILKILNEQAASPAMMAKLLDLPLGTVSYHTKVLVETDCVSLVKTEARRGALEHFYRAKPRTALGSRDWQKVPASLRGDLIAASLDGFCTSVVRALQAESFRRLKDSCLVWQPFAVDQEGWAAIIAILREAEERVRDVADQCAKRLDDPTEAISIVVAFSAFEAGTSGTETA